MTQPRCDTCRWWQRSTTTGEDGTRYPATYGECRACAPRRNHADYGTRRPFAQVQPDDWCGEWDEKPEPRMDSDFDTRAAVG